MLPRYTRIRRYAPIPRYRLKPRRGKIEDPKYKVWIKAQPCMIQNRECRGPIDPNHVGHCGHGRDNDFNCVPLCRRHHDLYHIIHRRAFEERYGVSFSAAIQGLNEEYELTKARRIDMTTAKTDAAAMRAAVQILDLFMNITVRHPEQLAPIIAAEYASKIAALERCRTALSDIPCPACAYRIGYTGKRSKHQDCPTCGEARAALAEAEKGSS